MRRFVRLLGVVLAGLLAVPLLGAVAEAAVPAAPGLESPANGFVTAVNPPLSWTPDATNDSYRVQMSTTNSFSSFEQNTTTANSNFVADDELPTGMIYWRVQAHNGDGWGPFSATRSFEKTDRNVPVPLDPPDGSNLEYPNDPVVVTWQEVANATGYNVQIDDEPTFTSPLLMNQNSDNDGMTVDPTLTMDSTVYWRVRALLPGGAATQFSPTWTFTVVWPEVPTLVGPPNTFNPPISEVVLEWTPTAGAQTYQLQVSPNVDFTNNTIDVSNLEATRWSKSTAFENGAYYWRVRAEHVWGGFGAWSQIYNFTKAWPAPGDAFPAVTLLTPSNGNFNVAEPNFSWTPQTRAAEYEVWMGTDNNFTPGTYKSCKTNHTAITPYNSCTGLAPDLNTLYYWRVRGIDAPADILGVWSSTFTFIYNHQSVNLNTPADGAVTDFPVLTWDLVPGITKYRVTVNKFSGSKADGDDVYNDTWVPDSLNPADGPFSWYVQTIDDDGNLGAIPAPIDWYSFTLIDPVVTFPTVAITSPAGIAGIFGPLLTWTPVDPPVTKYQVWVRPQGAPAFSKYADNLKLPGWAYPDGLLATGTWEFYIQPYNGAVPLAASGISSFVIDDLAPTTLLAPTNCVFLASCDVVLDTPTLQWQSVYGAESYIVTAATDVNFTNIVKTYETRHTQLTPSESFVDAQASQALYWYARPCYRNEGHCGAEPGSYVGDPTSPVFAFRKQSPEIVPLSPLGGTDADQITFDWEDYLVSNQALGLAPTQEAERYRIQVSSKNDFSSNVFTNDLVDETTFTDPDQLYPDGPIFWRVQARDNSGNYLTFGPVQSLTKVTPPPALPDAGSRCLGDLAADVHLGRTGLGEELRHRDLQEHRSAALVGQPSVRRQRVDTRRLRGQRPRARCLRLAGPPTRHVEQPAALVGHRQHRTASVHRAPEGSRSHQPCRRFERAEQRHPAVVAAGGWGGPVPGPGRQRPALLEPVVQRRDHHDDMGTDPDGPRRHLLLAGDQPRRLRQPDRHVGDVDVPLARLTTGSAVQPDGAGADPRFAAVGSQVGPYSTPWNAGTTREVQVANVFGVPASAEAVTLNVTVTNSTAPSFLTLYPDGTPVRWPPT